MGLPLEKEERRYTYADYKNWELEEGERYELIHGEAFCISGPNAEVFGMSGANTRHQAVSMELSRQISNYLRGKPCQVFAAPYDIRLFYEEDENDDTVVQPDILVICDKEKIGTEGGRGAPDLVIEILSPSNTAVEMERKFTLYQEAGVREFWIVDSKNNGLKVHQFLNGEILTNIYGKTDTVKVSIFPDLMIDLEPVFAE